jgi:hypothetical protein
MTDNKKYRIQLEGQYKALDEHLQKFAKEKIVTFFNIIGKIRFGLTEFVGSS